MASISSLLNKQNKTDYEQDLIRYEAKIGGQIFGKISNNRTRQFFCLDEHTWIWHEEWLDEYGQKQSTTTRYVVRPREIIKSQNGAAYVKLSDSEKNNLAKAVKIYYRKITSSYAEVLAKLN